MLNPLARIPARLFGICLLFVLSFAILALPTQAQSQPPVDPPQTVITVSLNGDGDYADLAEAVAAAPAGALIRIGPGEYELAETLSIDKDLSLEGAGPSLAWISFDGSGHVAHLRGKHEFRLQGLALEHQGEGVGNALTVDNGRVFIDSCYFIGAAQGDGVAVLLGEGEIHNSVAYQNGMNGFAISGKTGFVLRNNVAQENGQHGFSLVGARGGDLQSNGAYENGQHGFYLFSSQNITATVNEAVGNQRWGMVVAGTSRTDLHQNYASQNYVGYVVGDSATANLSENEAEFNSVAGILLTGTAKADLGENSVARNAVGILVGDRTVSVLSGTVCSENFAFGIAVVDNASTLIEDSYCTGNLVGIYAAGQADVDLADNVVGDNRLAGLGFEDDAGGSATGTECIANRLGLVVAGNADPELADIACTGNIDADLVDWRIAPEESEAEPSSVWQPQDLPDSQESLSAEQCATLDLAAAYTATLSLDSLRLASEVRLSAGGPEMTLLVLNRQTWAGEDMGYYGYRWDGVTQSSLLNRMDLLGYSVVDLVDTVAAPRGVTQILDVGGEMTLRQADSAWAFAGPDQRADILAEWRKFDTDLYASAMAGECTVTQAELGGRTLRHYVFPEPYLYDFNQFLDERVYFRPEVVERRLDIWLDDETGALMGYDLAATQDVGDVRSYRVSIFVTDVGQPLTITLPLARPQEFPAAVPLPEDADPLVNGKLGLAFNTALAPADVLDFYRTALADWEQQIFTDTLIINGVRVDDYLDADSPDETDPAPADDAAEAEPAEQTPTTFVLKFVQGPTALYVTVPAEMTEATTPVVLSLLGPLPEIWAAPGSGNLGEAGVTPAITTTLPLTPTTPAEFVTLGEGLDGRGDYEAAVAAFTSALELDPGLVTAYLGRAMAFASLDEYDSALADLEQLLALDPEPEDRASAFRVRASVHITLEEWDLALADAESAVALAGEISLEKAAKSFLLRGILRSLTGPFLSGLADVNRALILDPAVDGGWLWRARIRLENGNFLTALPDLDRAVALQGEDPEVYYRRGLAFYSLDETESAIDDWGRCIALFPAAWDCYRERATAYTDLEEFDLALADLGRAIRLNKDDAFSYLLRARIYRSLDQPDLALADLDEALFVDDTMLMVLSTRGQLLVELGEIDAAIQDFRQLLELAQAAGDLYYESIASRALATLEP